MSTFKEYPQYDAIGLAELIKNKEINTTDVLEAAIARAEKYNPALNAIIYKMYDQARIATKTTDLSLPFPGVPFLLKDTSTFIKNTPSTSGSRFLQHFMPDHDSTLVSRYQRAGLITIGKTNLPEFGLNYVSESELFGACHNPWQLDITPGGSSGGSAAAVAARIVPIAHANDGAGSIRVPAACCGLVGLKPTRARTPTGPDDGEVWAGCVANHVITVTVRDCAAVLDHTAGSEVGEPYTAPFQSRPFLQEVTTDPGTLNIAFNTTPETDVPVDAECIYAVESTAKLCEALGHHVEPATPHYDADALGRAMMTIVVANLTTLFHFLAQLSQQTLRAELFEKFTWEMHQLGEKVLAADYCAAIYTVQKESRKIAQFFQKYDLLMTPTTAKPPVKIGYLSNKQDSLESHLHKQLEFSPFTTLFNQTGQPAMSLPLHWTDNNIPIGVQLAGRFGDEATLFRIAAQLEQAKPWKEKIPDLAH